MKIACLLLAFAIGAFAADLTAKVTDVPNETYTAKVLEQSGKITFTVENTKGLSETVTIEMDSLREIDNAGALAGSVNGINHEITSFSPKTFAFSSISASSFQGLSVRNFTYRTSDLLAVGDGSELVIDVFIFTQNGTVDMDGTSRDVQAGNMKFNVALNRWPFCVDGGIVNETTLLSNCTSNGEFVDLAYTIVGRGVNSIDQDSDTTFFVGENAFVIFSDQVTVDENEVDLPSDFPKLTADENGAQNTIVLRFPKGNAISYDPIVSLAGSSAATVSASIFLAFFVFFFAKIF